MHLGQRFWTVCLASLLAGVGLVPSPAEAQVAVASTGWRQVTTGTDHTCAIRTTGRLYCWGDGSSGQLGTGSLTDRRRPTQVAGGGTDWVQVVAGQHNTCGRRLSGRLYCWGLDRDGQLGDGGGRGDSNVPVQVAGGFTDWSGVSVGLDHVCGRRGSGRLFCWGNGDFGQLGDGRASGIDRTTPTLVLGGYSDWISVSAADNHTCAPRANGRLYCWGWNANGRLGIGQNHARETRTTPTEVAGARTDWRVVAVSGGHSCALRADRRLFCWGDDYRGNLGDGSGAAVRWVPTAVAGGFADWVEVRAGAVYSGANTCARRAGGQLYCWGGDNYGQLGNGGDDIDRFTPGLVSGFSSGGGGFDADEHGCSLRTDTSLFCWGSNYNGELGTGRPENERDLPEAVLAPA